MHTRKWHINGKPFMCSIEWTNHNLRPLPWQRTTDVGPQLTKEVEFCLAGPIRTSCLLSLKKIPDQEFPPYQLAP